MSLQNQLGGNSMTNSTEFERIYRNVRHVQKKELLDFRAAHPPRGITVAGNIWEYITGGQGQETLVIFPGGTRSSEVGFRLIQVLENDYRVIGPTYGCVNTMDELVEGIRAILDAEGVQQAHCFGSSLGGTLVQCFVRKYPQRVKTVIAGDTTIPDKALVKKARRNIQLARWIPMWLIRRAGLRRLEEFYAALPAGEREFWNAYMREASTRFLNKPWTVSASRCGADFFMNYSFSRQDLEPWQGRILLIESDDDQAFGLRQREALKATYPQAQVHTFHAAGHIPAITREPEYITLIRDFLKQEQKTNPAALPVH
jgi:pimeloyl-ACP methyl ester carboxylesterase